MSEAAQKRGHTLSLHLCKTVGNADLRGQKTDGCVLGEGSHEKTFGAMDMFPVLDVLMTRGSVHMELCLQVHAVNHMSIIPP